MADDDKQQEAASPDLKKVLGAMIFASKDPITVREIRKVLGEVGKVNGDSDFSKLKDKEIKGFLDDLESQFEGLGVGLHLVEFADGYRIQTDPDAGPWLKSLLKIGRQSRLSRPALETLAIIAYRQPVVRSEIEGVRGVNVDHILRTLMEAQLIKLVGRSDLPGRPLMYGTTHYFLEHFGLKDVKELPGIEALSRAEADRIKAEEDKSRAEMAAEDGEASAEESDSEESSDEPAGESESNVPVEDSGQETVDASGDDGAVQPPRPQDEPDRQESDDDDDDEYDDDDDDD